MSPLYDYECPTCLATRTELLPIPKKEEGLTILEPLVQCICGQKMVRVISKVNFSTKHGRGFFGSKPKA